jgi:hypothetical protein
MPRADDAGREPVFIIARGTDPNNVLRRLHRASRSRVPKVRLDAETRYLDRTQRSGIMKARALAWRETGMMTAT